MLDKLWNPSKNKTFNPSQDDLDIDFSYKEKYRNLVYYTQPFEEVFLNWDRAVIFSDMAKQQEHIKKEVEIYAKYEYFNKTLQEKILNQYKLFYYHNWYYYNKWKLNEFLTRDQNLTNTFITAQTPQTPQTAQTPQTTQKKQTLTVSTEAIRKITWYSPYVIPAWAKDWKTYYLEWQDKILQDKAPIILVDGSRQIWKSKTIAEKAVELSFLPNEDTLVGGFIKKTTDVIRNYILQYIQPFPENTFEHFKSEGYILNTKSWTKIYFRTLDNWAENVLGLTLHNIIVDEAQLIPTQVFEDVLEPTLATTNWRMILIWTPWRSAKGYYYDLIMDAKINIEHQWKKIAVTSPTNPDVSYYQIDYTQNPLISPRLRKKIEANLNKASTQRQYLCRWDAWEDQLFRPEIINEYPTLSQDGYFVITFDPARKWTDRSAYSVSYTFNWVIYILISGFVPKVHKSKWSKQIQFYTKWLIKQFEHFEKLTFGVDLRGIWEWFSEAWMNHYKNPEIKSQSLIEITYTTWNAQSIKWLDWKVSKTLLISNAIDYMDEGTVKVLKVANKDLIEEMQFCYEDEDRKGFIAMKSTYKDDIVNTMLTNIFIIHIRKFIKRSSIISTPDKSEFSEWNNEFAAKKTQRINSIW